VKEEPIVVLDDDVAEPSCGLPNEAMDIRATELHDLVVDRLVDVLRHLFGDSALVLSDIFVRVDETDRVAPDLLIIPSVERGRRTAYQLPREPVPSVTVQVLSSASYNAAGRAELARKRAVLGRIGVPTHIEVHPERAFITVWRNTGSYLVVGPPSDHYDGPALGGLRIEAVKPGVLRLFLPDGREFVDAPTARVDAEAERAKRLEEAVRQAGRDPASSS
jgi:hypothetical protein